MSSPGLSLYSIPATWVVCVLIPATLKNAAIHNAIGYNKCVSLFFPVIHD